MGEVQRGKRLVLGLRWVLLWVEGQLGGYRKVVGGVGARP